MSGDVVVYLVVSWVCLSARAAGIDREEVTGWTPWEVTVTAYCPCRKCCGRCADGQTASGVPARGKLIAAPKSIPFDTRIFVPGYGVAAVQDRGKAIRGDRLDVLFETHAEAMRFGRRKMTVLVNGPVRQRQQRRPTVSSNGSDLEDRSAQRADSERSTPSHQRQRYPRPSPRRDRPIVRAPNRRPQWPPPSHTDDLSSLISPLLQDEVIYIPNDEDLLLDLQTIQKMLAIVREARYLEVRMFMDLED